MNLATWAERNGVARVAASRWLRAGLLPVPARRVGLLIPVDGTDEAAATASLTAVCARVASADQKRRLERQVARVTARATRAEQVGGLLRDPTVARIVVEHRDRFCQCGSEYVEVALVAQGRELVVVNTAEVDDALLRDMAPILTSMCARLYGNRAAQNRAKRALAAATAEGGEGA